MGYIFFFEKNISRTTIYCDAKFPGEFIPPALSHRPIPKKGMRAKIKKHFHSGESRNLCGDSRIRRQATIAMFRFAENSRCRENEIPAFAGMECFFSIVHSPATSIPPPLPFLLHFHSLPSSIPSLLPFPPFFHSLPSSIPAKAGISSRVSGKFCEAEWSACAECGYPSQRFPPSREWNSMRFPLLREWKFNLSLLAKCFPLPAANAPFLSGMQIPRRDRRQWRRFATECPP